MNLSVRSAQPEFAEVPMNAMSWHSSSIYSREMKALRTFRQFFNASLTSAVSKIAVSYFWFSRKQSTERGRRRKICVLLFQIFVHIHASKEVARGFVFCCWDCSRESICGWKIWRNNWSFFLENVDILCYKVYMSTLRETSM